MVVKNQKGMSLLEVLLAISVMTVLITGAVQIFDDWFKRSINQKVASEMLELQDAAEQYVKLNHEYILNDEVPNVGDIAEIDFDAMIDGGFVSPNYRARNSFGQSLRVLIRNVNDATVAGVALEVIAVSDDLNGDSRMADARLFDAALAGGPQLGLISALELGVNCCDGNIQSANGEWSVSLNDFSALYNATPDLNRGGYMAAYGRVSLNDSIDDRYLYRVEMDGQDHLNRMMTNMDLNGRDIVNAGTIVSDNMSVTGDTVLNGNETNGFSSPYVLAVRDNFEAPSMVVTRDGNSKGDIVVQGDNDNATFDFDVTGNMTLLNPSGSVITNIGTVNTVQNMGSAVFDQMNARAGSFNAGSIVAVNTQINNDVQTTFLQTSSASVNAVTAANAVTAITTVTGATTTIDGNLDSNNNMAISGDAMVTTAGGIDSVSISNLSSCGAGCP